MTMQPPGERDARNAALAFFGRIAADLSHELRNRFATINEKDGLLSDLLELSRRGGPTDPERLVSLSSDIKKHVDLAQVNCSDLSRFAHLTDDETREENLDEIVALIARLTRRRGLLHGMEIASRDRAHVSARVNPFQLGFAVFQCLDWALGRDAPGKLEISALRIAGGAGVEIRGADFSDLLASVPGVMEATLREVPGRLDAGEGGAGLIITIEEEAR